MVTSPKIIDVRADRMLKRWLDASPPCPECGRALAYLPRSEVWICRLHGDMWSGQALAMVRGYWRDVPAEPLSRGVMPLR